MRRLELFIGIDKTSRGRPLIIELPTMFDQPRAFAKSIRATEQNCNNVTREDTGVLALLDHFGFPVGGKNQAFSRASCPARLHAVDAARSQKFGGVSQEITQRAFAALKRDLPLLLRNIETEAGLVHRVASQPRHVLGGWEGAWVYVPIKAMGVLETVPLIFPL